ncbi:MAG: glycosyltransferase family 4 protein [Actinomycetota bacterium]
MAATDGADSTVDSIVVFAVGYRWHDLLQALYRAVERPGLEVVPDGVNGALARTLRPGETGIVHLNWASEVVAVPRRTTAIRRVAAQVVQLVRVRRRGYRIVWTVHNDHNHEGLHVGLERRYQAVLARCFADRIVALSEYSAALVRARGGRRVAAKVRVIPLCTSEEVNGPPRDTIAARRELGISPDRTVLLLFGSLREYKGLHQLRAALSELRDLGDRFVLCVAGAPSDPGVGRAAREMAAEFDNVVTVLERIPRDAVATWISAADWLVLPYTDILNSGVAMLALTYRVPVVVPRIAALDEVVSVDGALGGIAFDPGAPHALAEALRHALEVGAERYTAMHTVLTTAARRHDPTLVAAELRAVYEELATPRPR